MNDRVQKPSDAPRYERVLEIFQKYERGELTKREVLEQMPDIKDVDAELQRISDEAAE